MNKSLKKNSLFYLFYNVLNMLFPFVSSLYVARVLLPESIGEVAYAQNVVSYFSILAFLGIPTYGIKAIAKARDSREEMDAVFSELFIINGISTVFFTAIYYALIFIVPTFRANLALYATAGLTVILVLLISPVGYLLGSRVMLVTDRESRMALCVCMGAFVNVTGNFFLIRTLCERGAAIASVVSETVVMVMYVLQGRRAYKLNRYGDTVAKAGIAGLLEAAVLAALRAALRESWLTLGAQVAAAAVVYVGALILLNEPTVRDTLSGLANKTFHRGGTVDPGYALSATAGV